VAQVADTPQKPAATPHRDYEGEAKAYIYFKESSNNPAAVNSIGCYGLGQDCNDVLRHECPNWRTDTECQDTFWDKYAARRYGSWVNAMAFWQVNKWW